MPAPAGPFLHGLAARIDAALPQTQCTRCGYPDCASYAQAVADGAAAINRCPPGGDEGIARLAALTGQALAALDPDCGAEAPRGVAVIDEDWCIGCTLCLQACPVDAIVGLNKRMHTVVAQHCTGCELCLPACPVDCIRMEAATGARTGWQAWTPQQAAQARMRHGAHQRRKAGADERSAVPSAVAGAGDKRAAVAAALARARAQRGDDAQR
ncbi:ferredoxin [Melaminivora suipulveris]|uniref:Ferredoxin n=1 Tax=Melaminivora suipulveris TaxID=2109913 RepID=A0A2R3Q856_9BURK|nr:RnfABCDGE type electron transport complex subunit B [Melaminivora suipulveris]AVO47972.1 ferredoxin [Melaminivora suipulveris]